MRQSAMQPASKAGMKWIPSGTFQTGADRAYPEEALVNKVTVGGFWIDEYAVTNWEVGSTSGGGSFIVANISPPETKHTCP